MNSLLPVESVEDLGAYLWQYLMDYDNNNIMEDASVLLPIRCSQQIAEAFAINAAIHGSLEAIAKARGYGGVDIKWKPTRGFQQPYFSLRSLTPTT